MANSTEAAVAARVAKGLSGEFKAAFERILKEHQVPDWQLQSFTLTRRTVLESEGCPPGQEFDCRQFGTEVVCKCFPKKF